MGDTARAVLITGSTGGIGLSIARAFGAEGWRVGVNSAEPGPSTEKILESVADAGAPEVRYFEADLSEPSVSAGMVDEAISQFGGLDALVNATDIHGSAPLETLEPEDWRRTLAVGVDSAFGAIKAALPGMKQRGWGRIINIASSSGLRGAAQQAAIAAARHALVGLTRSVALEVAEAGVTVNAICPGHVWTPHAERRLAEEMQARGRDREHVIREVLLADQPNRRFVQPEEIGALCLYLCGDMAVSITGSAISMDGGMTA